MPLWQSQQLAFVVAAGSPDATRSHFDAQDYMESGTPGRKGTSDGWMNRLAGQTLAPGQVRNTNPRRLGRSDLAAHLCRPGQCFEPCKRRRRRQADGTGSSSLRRRLCSKLYRRRPTRLSHDLSASRSLTSHKEVLDRRSTRAAMTTKEQDGRRQRRAAAERLSPTTRRGSQRLMRNDPNVSSSAFVAARRLGHARGAGRGASGQLANRLVANSATGLLPLLADRSRVRCSTTRSSWSCRSSAAPRSSRTATAAPTTVTATSMWVLGGPVAGGKVHGQLARHRRVRSSTKDRDLAGHDRLPQRADRRRRGTPPAAAGQRSWRPAVPRIAPQGKLGRRRDPRPDAPSAMCQRAGPLSASSPTTDHARCLQAAAG